MTRPVFARGLEVIRSVSAAAPRQTLSAVAARTGLTRAGARRILLTLQALGYVESDGKLFVLEGTDIVYVMRVPTRKIMRNSLGVGSRLPAYCTSMGRILMAGLPDEEVLALLHASTLEARTRHTLTDPQAILAKVRQARRQGWCLVNQELEEGVVSLAAPVLQRSGRIAVAMNISGQANRTSPRQMQETMLEPLLETAQEISRRMPAG